MSFISKVLGGGQKARVFRLLKDNKVAITRTGLLGPEGLETRRLLAGFPNQAFSGKDTSDDYMRPALREGDPVNPQWNMEKIRAADTWWLYDGKPSSVVVVMDYGIDYQHEDFASSQTVQGQLWDFGKIHSSLTNNFRFSKRGRDDYNWPVDIEKESMPVDWNEVTQPAAGQYFGNIGAGIIGARTDNKFGVAGINWDVQMYSSKVVVNDSTSHFVIAQRANRMVQYLRMGKVPGIQDNPNPQLIRAVSFGYSSQTDYGDIFNDFAAVPEDAPDGAGHYDFVALGSGIQQLTGDPTQGILVTVPTGDWNKTWPTNHYDEGKVAWDPTAYDTRLQRQGSWVNYEPGIPDNILAVAATDIYDVPWVGNARNPIDIYAPGVNIVSVGEQKSSYPVGDGTRQAQAHVAGAIAIIYDAAEQHGRSVNYHEVREAIIRGGDFIGLDRPRLNIVGALKWLGLDKRPEPLAVSVTISGGESAEKDSGSTAATFQLELSRAIDVPVTVGVRIEDGTATAADRDFVVPNASRILNVTVPAGARTGQFAVSVNGDRKVEGNESFRARIVSVPGNVKSGLGLTATWSILNDDALPVVSLGGARAVEGSQTRPGGARVVATLDRPSAMPVTVQYSVVNDTALAGQDFQQPVTRVVTFPANRTAMPIDIRFIGNSTAQPDRSFRVQIDSVTSGSPSQTGSSALVTIVDDDRIAVTIQPTIQAALVGGTATMFFTVRLSRTATEAEGSVGISYRTIDGAGVAAAIGGVDYDSTSGALVFNPGETVKTIAVTVLPRRAGQRYPKSLFLELSNVSAPGWLAGGVTSRTVLGRIS